MVDSGPVRQYFTFHPGDKVFAREIITVREIIKHATMTGVPMIPDFVLRNFNLCGWAMAVVDLLQRFGNPLALVGRQSSEFIPIIETDKALRMDAMAFFVDKHPG